MTTPASTPPRRLRTALATITASVLAVTGIMAGSAPSARAAQTARTVTAAQATQAAQARDTSQGKAPSTSRPANAGAQPRLTTNRNAPCNSKPAKGSAQCMAVIRTPADHLITPDVTGPPSTALGPADIQSAYSLPPGGQGQTVAIVDAFGDSHAASDLATFRATYGLPPCTTASGCFRQVNQAGGTTLPHNNNSWGVETSLDLDAVSSACPACHILLIEAHSARFTSLGKAVDEAVALGAKYVSNSYGLTGESSSELGYDHYYSHPGVVIAAASGDNGYDYQGWPASNPDVVGVGGTTLARNVKVSRGWAESAWSGSGSGCSPYEPKPAYQDHIVTDCSTRAVADISADADPVSGLATYDTLGDSGWLQVGGTSLASPLITAMYALAGGAPAADTYPVTYPYQDPDMSADLNDVTDGGSPVCPSGPVLCTAGPGWDGPTGLGTPHGVKALAGGPRGDITGQVTDKTTGKPLAGVTVTAPGGYAAATSADGTFDLYLPPGTYTVTGQAFRYQPGTQSEVTVTAGGGTTVNLALAAAPEATLSGTVADGSGHGWPLYAKIIISGDPSPIYTNPATGRYRVELPQQASYTISAAPVYPGYSSRVVAVAVGTTRLQQNIKVKAQLRAAPDSPKTIGFDFSACTAPGYAWKYQGLNENFTGWSGHTSQNGWTNTDNIGNGQTWDFSNLGDIQEPPPDTDGDFSSVFTDYYGATGQQDTELVSPVINLSGITNPEIGFDESQYGFAPTYAVDISLDGGTTWTNVNTNYLGGRHLAGVALDHRDFAIPQAAGQSDVRVRFHVTNPGGGNGWWALGNVFVGTRSCAPVPGGLVTGVVKDANTGQPVNGATITAPGASSVTAAPGDPAVPGGFYWLFTPSTGSQQFTAADSGYTTNAAAVNVAANAVTTHNWALNAGHLTVSTDVITSTQTLGQSSTAKITFSNDGTAPLHLTLAPASSGFTSAGAQPASRAPGAPLTRVRGRFTLASASAQALRHVRSRSDKGQTMTAPGGSAWGNVANYPLYIYDNAVAYDPQNADVYSVGGVNGSITPSSYVYNPASQRWSRIASLPLPLEAPAAAFAGSKLYTAGGWNGAGGTSSVYAYDPSSGNWSQAARLPEVLGGGAAAAVLNGQMYVIGGCGDSFCEKTSQLVFRYNPSSNAWTQLASYPAPVAWGACAGIAGEIACAGGANGLTGQAYNSTYIYNPAANTWTQGADMPYDDWGMAYAGAGNQLQIVDGITANGTETTNQAEQYDPATNSWSSLPNASNPEYRGGGGCGLYQVGGISYGTYVDHSAEILPGFNQCQGTVNAPWLSASSTRLSLPPGQSATVTVSMDSSKVAQPGHYTADLAVSTDTPYFVKPLGISMTAQPPATWGELTGKVTDAKTGKPIAGATVQITTGNGKASYTAMTDTGGHYQWWLDAADDPLQVIAAKDGYAQQVKQVSIRASKVKTLDFALSEATASGTRRPHRS